MLELVVNDCKTLWQHSRSKPAWPSWFGERSVFRVSQGWGVGIAKSLRLLGGVGVGFLRTLGFVRSFLSTPEFQLNHLLHRTPKLGIPVEMAQFLLKLLLKQSSCCEPRFSLIASCNKIVVSQTSFTCRSRKFWKGRSRIFYLRLAGDLQKAGHFS